MNFNSEKDILVTASNIGSDKDINIEAKGSVQILSDQEESSFNSVFI